MEMDGGPPGDPPPISVGAPSSTRRDVPPTPLVSEPDSDTWGTWSVTQKEQEDTHAMGVDDSAATSAGGPLGDPPAEEAVVVAPHPWHEALRRTWEETAGKVDLKELQIGFVSTPEILFEQANQLFEAAHLEAIGRTEELLPLPAHNADGSELAPEDRPIGTIVWPEEEVRFFGNDEEQNVGDDDGFQMDDLNEMPSFQSDEYIGFTGGICNITKDWNTSLK